MPIQAEPDGTLDVENATLRSRNIVSLTNMVAGNDEVRSSAAPTLEVYGDPSHGGTEPTLELVSNTSNTVSTTFTRLTSNAGVLSVKSGTDASDNGTITFGGFQNERLRITSDGKVGVGTDDPGAELHVMGDIIGRSISKTRTITKGTSLSGEVNNFAFEADENRILLNNNQGSVNASREYTANFTTGVPTAIGTIIHLEINSSRTNNSASGVNHRTTIQFNSVDVLSTGNIYLPPSVPAYQRNLKRTIILTTDGWVDYSLYPCVSKSVVDDAVIVSATNNARKASVGVDNPLTEVMRVQLNGFGDPQVGINCVPAYDQTLDVNGSLNYTSGGLNSSDDRIKYNEQGVSNALTLISQLNPQKYEKIMKRPNPTEGTWIPTDEEWENVKEDYTYGDEFGFIAQDVRNIPELSFLVHGEETRTDTKTSTPEEYSNLTTEEQSTYTISYLHESNVITQAEYSNLNSEEQETCVTQYTKQIETQTPLALNYQGLFVVAIGAIKELKAKNESLEARITALENA
jgi:hypothetical protein